AQPGEGLRDPSPATLVASGVADRLRRGSGVRAALHWREGPERTSHDGGPVPAPAAEGAATDRDRSRARLRVSVRAAIDRGGNRPETVIDQPRGRDFADPDALRTTPRSALSRRALG